MFELAVMVHCSQYDVFRQIIVVERTNIYTCLLKLCIILVRLEYVATVYLNFILVGHIYKDIDQRFNVIMEILKCQDIDSIQ